MQHFIYLNCLASSEFAFSYHHEKETELSFLQWAWKREIIVLNLFVAKELAKVLVQTDNIKKLCRVEILRLLCDKQDKNVLRFMQQCKQLKEFQLYQSKDENIEKVNNGSWLIPIFKTLDEQFLRSASLYKVEVLSKTWKHCLEYVPILPF